MRAQDLKPYITKFIRVTLRDGTMHSGFVKNYSDFKNDLDPEELQLLNGLLSDSVPVSEIIFVDLPEREDTVSIPVLDEDLIKKYNRG